MNERSPLSDGLGEAGPQYRSNSERVAWSAVGVLYRWRRFILGVSLAAAIAAVGLSLLIPNDYAARARLLSPEPAGNQLASAVLRSLPSAASLFMGGASGEYARYLTILTSRAMYESAVDSFDLVTVYGTDRDKHPREAAIEQLEKNVDFPVHEKYEYLSVVAVDRNPDLAADLANFFVRRLNRVNGDLASQNAALFRRFVERRHGEANMALDSVLDARQQFQNTHGVFDLPAQTTAFFEQVASLRAAAAQNEVQFEALRAQLGEQNPQVQSMREVVRAAQQQYASALAGQERVLPVPQQQISGVMREYVDLERERLIQTQIIEVITPVLEQARFNEEQEVQAVQVVDPAVPPVKKVGPRRSIIVIVTAISVFLLAIIFALATEWWHRNHRRIADQLYAATAADRTPRPRHSVQNSVASQPEYSGETRGR